jgi:hypothetical protein
MASIVSSDRPTELPEHLQIVAEALDRLKYGVIQLTVHNGKLMQVDVTERRRFT